MQLEPSHASSTARTRLAAAGPAGADSRTVISEWQAASYDATRFLPAYSTPTRSAQEYSRRLRSAVPSSNVVSVSASSAAATAHAVAPSQAPAWHTSSGAQSAALVQVADGVSGGTSSVISPVVTPSPVTVSPVVGPASGTSLEPPPRSPSSRGTPPRPVQTAIRTRARRELSVVPPNTSIGGQGTPLEPAFYIEKSAGADSTGTVHRLEVTSRQIRRAAQKSGL